MLELIQTQNHDQVHATIICFCYTKMSSKCKMLEIKTNEKSRYRI